METSRIDNKTPRRAVHPSEIIKDEIDARDMSKKEFAERMGMKASNVSRLLRGENDITVQVAEKLEDAFGIPASHWTAMQHAYNREVKEINERNKEEITAIEIESRLSEIFNLGELYKRLGIGCYMFVQKKLEKLGEILHTRPTDIMSMMPTIIGVYKSTNHHIDDKNLRTWTLLAYVSSLSSTPRGKYYEGNALCAAQQIRDIAHSGVVTEAKMAKILNDNGIAYSVVKKIEAVPVDGFSTYACGYPSIVTTHRFDDMNRLVFTILHELGHIHLHFKDNEQCSFVSFGDTVSSDNAMEMQANTFAQTVLINDDVWKDIMNTTIHGLYTENIVSTLKKKAKEFGLSFPIVLWRYKYETKKYNIRGGKTAPIV